MKEILEKLRKRVKENNLTQTAKELSLNPSVIHCWIKGKRKPTGENLLKLMEYLN